MSVVLVDKNIVCNKINADFPLFASIKACTYSSYCRRAQNWAAQMNIFALGVFAATMAGPPFQLSFKTACVVAPDANLFWNRKLLSIVLRLLDTRIRKKTGLLKVNKRSRSA